MIEAFSKANENCDVGFAVNASNLSKCQRNGGRIGDGHLPGKGNLDMVLIHRKP